MEVYINPSESLHLRPKCTREFGSISLAYMLCVYCPNQLGYANL